LISKILILILLVWGKTLSVVLIVVTPHLIQRSCRARETTLRAWACMRANKSTFISKPTKTCSFKVVTPLVVLGPGTYCSTCNF